MRTKLLKLVTLLAVLGLSTTSIAQAAPSSENMVTHLKINQYYVLYTAPKAPYIDSRQRLMVPLRSISELLGATVAYDSKSKTADIKMDTHLLRLTINSKLAHLDGKQQTMDTVPVMYNNSMIVPLKVVLDAFQLKAAIDPDYGYVNLQDSRLMKTKIIASFEEFDSAFNDVVDNEQAFLPLQTSIVTEKAGAVSNVRVAITAHNISGGNIAAGREDLHPVFLTKGQYILDADGSWTDSKARNRPAVQKGDKIERVWNFSVQANDPLLYILAKGRSFSQSVN